MPNRRCGRRSRCARHQTKLKNSRRYTKAKEKQKESKNTIEKSTSISCRQQAKRIERCFKYIQSLCNEQRTKMEKTSEFDSNIYIKSKFPDINEDNISMTAISDNNNVVLWLSNLHQLVCVGYLRNNIGNIKPNDLASIIYRYLGNLLIQPNTKFVSCCVDYHKNGNNGNNGNNNNGNNKSVLWAFKIWDNEAHMQRSYQQIILKIALFSKDSVISIGKHYVTIALIGLPKKNVSELDLARFESLLHSDENITLQYLQSVSNIDFHVIKFSLSTMNRYEKSKKICLLCDLNENGVYYIDKNKNKIRNKYCDGVLMTELNIHSYKYINSNFNNDQFVRDEFNINQNKCFVMFNNEYDYKYLCICRANGTSCNVTIETANIANLNSFYLQQPSAIYKEVRSKNKK